MRLYINGVLKNTVPQSGTLATNTETAKIGTWQGTNYNLTGRVSNLSIYNRVLTAAEVLQNYNALRPRFGDVTNPTTGKIWMDRNLGASRVATSSTDHLAYGSLYQWGRGSDGHELVNWIPGHVGQDGGTGVNGTTSVLSSTDSPGNSNFIISSGLPVDWRSGQNANLWQGVNGINNPCPAGYRIPTRAEWAAEFATWSSQNVAGAFASPLKLTMAGQRNDGAGFFFAGQIGYYWTSTTSTTQSQHISIDPSGSYTSSNSSSFRANAYSIRCIRN
jgi:uncharacterized protein (TIGR02145 family)